MWETTRLRLVMFRTRQGRDGVFPKLIRLPPPQGMIPESVGVGGGNDVAEFFFGRRG